MQLLAMQSPTCNTEFSTESKKGFMLATNRTAHARVQMLALEIAEIGASLRHDMITAEGAVTWLDHISVISENNVQSFLDALTDACDVPSAGER